MPVVISLINLKGGVAKTTTTVQIADYLSFAKKRVLVIDLDPQSNATESLLGRSRALAVSPEEELPTGGPKNRNISQCFFDYLENTQYFEIDKVRHTNTSNLRSVTGPDLLPASLKLLDVQDRLGEIAQKSGYMISPVEVLKFAISPIFHEYDLVLIDCPPSLNLMTRNALEISDYYLVPVINDPLSTRGLYQILKRVNDYSKIRQWRIQCLGVLITKYRNTGSNVFIEEQSQLKNFVQGRCQSIKIQVPHTADSGSTWYTQNGCHSHSIRILLCHSDAVTAVSLMLICLKAKGFLKPWTLIILILPKFRNLPFHKNIDT